ncbi:DNA-binding ATP-dependent protease La [Klebsiella oxytoca]|nr:DNA-binding ATP-dependent protease La [Klebsiella oxytoca]
MKNKRDLEEIPDNVIADLDIHPVKRIEEVLALALQNEPFGMGSRHGKIVISRK